MWFWDTTNGVVKHDTIAGACQSAGSGPFIHYERAQERCFLHIGQSLLRFQPFFGTLALVRPPFGRIGPSKQKQYIQIQLLKFSVLTNRFSFGFRQIYGLLLQNFPILPPRFRAYSLRIHYAGRKRPSGRGAPRAQIHPGYGTGVPANPHKQKKNPPAFRLRDLVRVARVELTAS